MVKRKTRRRGYRKKESQDTKTTVVLLCLGILFIALVILVMLEEREAQQAIPGSLTEQSIPVPQEGMVAEEDTVVEQPPLVMPTELTVPVGGWQPYAFTPEQTEQLDTFLEEWAAKEQPLVPQEEVEAQDIESTSELEEEPDPDEGHRVALYFLDMDSGAQYIFNGEENFDVASLSKAPYALYLYQLVEQGEASLEETFLIDEQSIVGSEENSGILKDDENLPRELSLAEMIEYLLRYSDTVAQRELLKRYPASGFAQWAAELGVNNAYSVTGDSITAPQAGIYLAALYEYMQTGLYGLQLQEHLMNTRYPIITSSWPMARKYGWDEHAYHDMAVVYASHPYLIAILTDKSVGASEDRQNFTTVTNMLEQMLQEHWATAQTQAINQKPGIA